MLINVYSYCQFTTTSIDGKPRLEIAPSQGMTASPLPAWLTTPYLVHVQSQDFTITREGCENPAITSGDTISDSSERKAGTFSFLMNAIRPNHELMWI